MASSPWESFEYFFITVIAILYFDAVFLVVSFIYLVFVVIVLSMLIHFYVKLTFCLTSKLKSER